MFILQTLREFIDNPMGKGSNAIPSRQLIRDDLKNRLDKILSNKDKDIKLSIYKYRDMYFFHFLIPSENMKRKNTYDVVLQFIPNEDSINQKNLNNYHVKFFSNSPSFTYTYAYAFNLYGLFIEELSNKFDKIIFENPPVTRNPGEVISYEKTIFFACQYLIDNSVKYLTKSTIDLIAKKYIENDFVKKIRTSETIENEIKREDMRIKREEEKETKNKNNSSGRGNGPKLTGKNKLSSVKTTQQEKGGISKFTDKGKIVPRKSTITRIRPK